MTDEECNKIIAKYMGVEMCKCCKDGWDGLSRGLYYNCTKCRLPHTAYLACDNKYTRSLDALVPVWEKLGMLPMFNNYKGRVQCSLGFLSSRYTSNTIQQAAAYATAKAILELKND